MTVAHFLVDNNALASLTVEQRRSEFVRTRCRIPSEVLHEAAGFPDAAELKALEIPSDVDTIRLLTQVMEQVPAGDTSLVDLYANRGNADPILIATAMQLRARELQLLDPAERREWTIASDDKAVRRYAAKFDVPTVTAGELRAHLVHYEHAEAPD